MVVSGGNWGVYNDSQVWSNLIQSTGELVNIQNGFDGDLTTEGGSDTNAVLTLPISTTVTAGGVGFMSTFLASL